MKLFLATLLAVLALGEAQRVDDVGIAHQVYRTALNKLATGNTNNPQRTRATARCARCINNVAAAGYSSRNTNNLDNAVITCLDTCRQTIQNNNQDEFFNKVNNQQGIEDLRTAACTRCLVRNHLNGDTSTNVDGGNPNNNYVCSTNCRTTDLDRILTRTIAKTIRRGRGDGGGVYNDGFRGTDWL